MARVVLPKMSGKVLVRPDSGRWQPGFWVFDLRQEETF
jgi:hypothetical protein